MPTRQSRTGTGYGPKLANGCPAAHWPARYDPYSPVEAATLIVEAIENPETCHTLISATRTMAIIEIHTSTSTEVYALIHSALPPEDDGDEDEDGDEGEDPGEDEDDGDALDDDIIPADPATREAARAAAIVHLREQIAGYRTANLTLAAAKAALWQRIEDEVNSYIADTTADEDCRARLLTLFSPMHAEAFAAMGG